MDQEIISIDRNSWIIYQIYNIIVIKIYCVINGIIIPLQQRIELKSRELNDRRSIFETGIILLSDRSRFEFLSPWILFADRRNEIGMLHVSRQSSIVSRDGKLKNRRGGRNTIPSTRLSCSWASDKGISNKMYENTSEEWIWEFRFPVFAVINVHVFE